MEKMDSVEEIPQEDVNETRFTEALLAVTEAGDDAEKAKAALAEAEAAAQEILDEEKKKEAIDQVESLKQQLG